MQKHPKLTIGMPVYDDYNGVWLTVQSLRLFHADVMPDCEILVIDNNPTSEQGKSVKKFIESWVTVNIGHAKYIPAAQVVGPSFAKNLVFSLAVSPTVLCIDSHVLLAPGSIKRLIEFYDANPDTKDLLSGPLVYDNLVGYSTHFDDVWRGEMWGIWGTDKRGEDPNAEPFEIPAQGAGLLSCRKNAWLRYNPAFKGFGGEEFYIHEKFRKQGRKCLCLPFLRWTHRFNRPGGIPYPLTRQNKVRNYIIGLKELDIPLDRCKKHFTEELEANMPITEWDTILNEVETNVRKPCNTCPDDETKQQTLNELYIKASTTPSDINEHCSKLRALASQCERVTEFGTRPEISTVALLAGQPKHFVTCSTQFDASLNKLKKLQGKSKFDFRQGDSLSVDIEETDMLFIDTVHTAERLSKELERHAPKVSRWIVLHDTEIFGERGEDGSKGLLVALREFMRTNPYWSVVYHTQNNHGLTVISRDPRDKQDLPGAFTMASNLAKSVAEYVMDGAKKVDSEVLESRLAVCTLCDQRTDNRCAVCGCFIDEKATWRVSECPLGKWPDTVDSISADKELVA